MIQFPQNVKDKIKDLINKTTTNSIKIYDSSKSSVTISGMKLDGVTDVSLSGGVVGEAVIGINDNADFFQERFQEQTLTITLLPTSMSIDSLNKLYKAQQRAKAHSTINVIENGVPVGNYVGYLTVFPDIDFGKKAEKRKFTFTIKDISKLVSSTTYIQSNEITTIQDGSSDSIGTLIGVLDEDDADLQHGRALEQDRLTTINNFSDTTTDGMANNLMNNDISDF